MIARRRHRLTIAAAVAVTAALLAGCSEEPGTEPGTAPSPTSAPSTAAPQADTAEQEARASALAAYDNYRKAYVAAAAADDPDGDELAKYTADPLLRQLKYELIQKRDQGLTTKGQPSWNAQVIKVNVDSRPFTATIEDCFDGTNWQTVYKSNGKPAGVPGQAKRYIVTAEAALYDDGRWLIRESTAQRERPC
ncbi:hypothetical protein Van01_54440 [Micromonospora andamanensis]|uniref:Secreted protein/lipoprotein n=1 Tax=Micromonospora andamanensis TaxID=1287068 RepID=A0ABQ4I2X2_9ACTN|nr:hypothetical protein Van01_54440 [Micromonospora andamanensis]